MSRWCLAIFLSLTTLSSALANNCPESKTQKKLPIKDQDGIGSCASNVASLMMQYNLGLPKAPSYLQLSMTYGGEVGDRKNDLYYRDERGRIKLFNYGAKTCGVINTAAARGYCDHDTFGFDFVGRSDPLSQQQIVLDNLANYLLSKTKLNPLGRELADPSSRENVEQRLATYYAKRPMICNESLKTFVAKRGLARARTVWQNQVRKTTNPQHRTALQQIIARTFNADGTPTKAALAIYEGLLNELRPSNFLSDVKESTFDVIWSANQRISTDFVIDRPSAFGPDVLEYRRCSSPPVAVLDYLLKTNSCGPSTNSIPQEFVDQAKDFIDVLAPYVAGTTDRESGLVGLLSPQCQQQMDTRVGSIESGCSWKSNKDATAAVANANTAVAEICAGRAVGVDVCTGFLASSSVVNSKFCTQDVIGVEGHEYHAMTMIGYRRHHSGRRQILLQNSWGQTCPFLQHAGGIPAALKERVECETLASGVPSGRFWVDEELLFQNTTGINTYRRSR